MAKKEFPFTQLVVIGGTGQTGHRLLELALEYSELRIWATSRKANALKGSPRIQWRDLDLAADTPLLLAQLEALGTDIRVGERTALVFAAAFTNVERCESEPQLSELVNERNTLAVMKWARDRIGATVVFYSTDYVFDGMSGPYSENAPRKAVSVYGRSKVVVEQWLEKFAPDSLILRTTGVYDYRSGAMNFLMQMLGKWSAGESTRVPNDQFANPVWAHDLARASLELLAHGAKGIYNVAGATQLARSDFAFLIASAFGFQRQLIEPVATSALGQKARRPLKGGLLCDKVKRELGWAPAGAREVLEALRWHSTK